MSDVRVLLVGVHGYGGWHLRNVSALSRRIGVRLVGLCDVRPPSAPVIELAGTVPFSTSLDDLLASTRPEVTIICTPIHTHVDLAVAALRSGSSVLLEKPPTASLADYELLLDTVNSTGLACQVGLQSLGSGALPAVRKLVADGAIGDVRGVGCAGAWARDDAYYARAPWAGRRRLDGVPVVDGALTNPFAHAVATAMAVAGAEDRAGLTRIETELYRANPIESDDTSCLRLTTSQGTTITVAATLCSAGNGAPYVRVHGSRGRITLWYKRHEVRIETPEDGLGRMTYPSTDLLENLVAHVRDPATPLLAPLSRTHGFMQVVEATRTAPEPTPISDGHHGPVPPGGGRVIRSIEESVERAADELSLFSELGLPWAAGPATTTTPGPAAASRR